MNEHIWLEWVMWHVCVRYIWHDSSIYTTRRVLVRFLTSIYLWDILNIWVESCHICVIYMSWVRSKISSDRVVSYIWTSHVTHTWNVQLCDVIHMSWVIWLDIWVNHVVSNMSDLCHMSVAAYFSVFPKCVAVCCSVLQCVAECCSVFQCHP